MAALRSRSVLALAAVLLAGCLNPAVPPGPSTGAGASGALPANWYERALEHGPDHDHTDVAQHMNASTPNFQLLGHDPLFTEHYEGKPAFGYGCGGIDTTAEGQRLDVIDAFQNDLSFVLEDVTDATHPLKVGEFYAQGMRTYDADITPDGRFVALAFDSLTRAPVPGPLSAPVLPRGEAPALAFRTCAAEGRMALPDAVAASQGVVLIDVTDPTKPAYADWDPTPGFNLHSVSTARIDDVTWVTGSVLTGSHTGTYFVFDQVQDTPLGAKLVRISTFTSPPVVVGNGSPAPVSAPLTNGHTDVALAKNPKDNVLYGYAADWEGGVVVIDLSQPQAPRLAGQWAPPHDWVVDFRSGEGGCFPGAIHEVLPVPELWDGKAILFAGQECPIKRDLTKPGGSVFILDGSDPANLRLLGSWHLPEDTGNWTVEYQASPHYLALSDRTLFVSDYHAGIWAVDVSGDLAAPPSIGVYVPAIPPPIAPPENGTVPFDEQVDAFPDGTLVANDDTTGVYVLRFDARDPAPPAKPFPYPEG